MAQKTHTFGELFKKYRLRSEFPTLAAFGDALARKGFVYEDSIYSHWQKNVRVPKDRKLLLALIAVFIERGGIGTLTEANALLTSAGQGYLTDEEAAAFITDPHLSTEKISPQNALLFLQEVAKSKRIIRTGWKMHRITDPESVAEHSYQLCVMAMIFADQLGVDREKLIQMAIIHDLGEIVTGDLVWSRGKMIDIKKLREKEKIEAVGLGAIFGKLKTTNEYKAIFEEMTRRRSPEVLIFWQLDKLEMAIQALNYEWSDHTDLTEFFVNTDLQLTHPFLRAIFAAVMAARPTLPARSRR